MNTADAAQLCQRLAARGVTLWADGEQLRFRAPKGVLTPDDLAELKAAKPAVLALLAADEGVRPDPDARHEPFPLTDVQAAYLLGRSTAFGYGGLGCHGYFEVAFPALDPERLAAAWHTLVTRHDMLRAVVHPDGYQRVLPEVPRYAIEVDDLRGTPAEHALTATRERMSHKVYQPDAWPLFELRITRTDDRDLLHVSIDLLIADYTSVQILLAELDACYRDPGYEPPPLEIGFRDWVLAERRRADSPAAEPDREWWLRRLDTLPPAPALPIMADAARTAPPRFRRLETSLDAAAWSRFRQRCAAANLTPTGALLAAYAEVIGRWSEEPAFTLNLTLLSRAAGHPDVARLVGDFTAVELLEVRADRGATFAQRAAALGDRLFADLDHRGFGGVRVLRELARRRGAAAALMPVVFTSTIGLADGTITGGGLAGTGELGYGVSQTPQVWIDCQVMEHAGSLRMHWDVREGVFPDGLVEDMFDAYAALLRRLLDAAVWSDSVPVELPAAQRERRAAVNATAAPIPDGLLHDGVLDQARRTPDRVAVIAGGRSISYRELVGRAAAVAARLRADGCRPAKPVGVLLDKGIDQIVAVLGVLMAGSPYLPVDTNQPAARRDAMLGNLPRLSAAPREWEMVLEHHSPLTSRREPAYVIHTSGSTGVPKGVMVSHRAALNTVADINRRYGVGPGDVVLGLAALGFDLSVYDIFGPLSVGGRLVLPDPDRRGDPSHWAELIAEHGVTLWNSVPAQLQLLHDYLAVSPEVELPTLRLGLLSGDWIPVTLPDAIRARLPGLRLVSLGGATEAAIWSIHHPIAEVPPGRASIPYGTPLSNQRFHVLDAELRPRPDHVPGELYIGGAGLATGYLNDPVETAHRFIPHPVTGERLYRTGDHGRYLPDGTIEFLGRRDTQVKIRGHRIELAEIESVLAGHPEVGAAAVIAAGTAPLERRLAAFVTPAPAPAAPATGTPAAASPPAASAAAVTAAARVAAEAALDGMNVDAAAELADYLDGVALRAMMAALRASGVFTEPGRVHRTDEVIAATGVAPRHHRLLRRWLRALTEHGMLDAVADGHRLAADPAGFTAAAMDACWRRVDDLGRTIGADYGAELIHYLRISAERLPELLRDEADPLDLLFPEGRVDVAEAAYRDNAISRYVNRALAATLAAIAAAGHPDGHRLRVLEVGAGVGGTTADLLDAVDTPVDYLFTDVSQFFLNRAAERFAGHPGLRYGLFDLNADYRPQGLGPNTFDVVICANVLHNARHAGQALHRLTELIRPGGWLLFIEATRDNYPLMASMEFKEGLTEFTDERAATDRTFHTGDAWAAMLDDLGAELAYRLPAAGHPLSRAGQHAFAARVKPGRAAPDAEALIAYLSERLPSHMLPAELQVVDALPLTGNGKLDRRALEGWLLGASGAAVADAGEPPRDDLEVRIATLWAAALGVARVGRDRDFYALGGDSLLVAQVVGRMREQLPEAAGIPWDMLLRQLVATPTVAAIAEHLRSRPAATVPAPATASPLVTLDASETGLPTMVLVHDGSGTLAPYQALITALREHGPLVGLAVADHGGYLGTEPGVLFELLATEYRDALLAAGHKRVHVVGYCMGGLLATELARQLTELGAEVTGLTVISSYQVPFLVRDDVLAEYAFARVTGVDPAAVGFPADERVLGAAAQRMLAANPHELSAPNDPPELARMFAELAGRPQPERLAAIAAASPLLDTERVEPVWRLFRHGLDAVTRFRAAPYAGDITFLRQLGDTPFLPGLRADMTAYWRELCLGRLRVHDIGGDHFGCLRQPHVDAVAALLRESW